MVNKGQRYGGFLCPFALCRVVPPYRALARALSMHVMLGTAAAWARELDIVNGVVSPLPSESMASPAFVKTLKSKGEPNRGQWAIVNCDAQEICILD